MTACTAEPTVDGADAPNVPGQESPGAPVESTAVDGSDELTPLEEYLGRGAVSFEQGFSISFDGTPVDGQPSEWMMQNRREFEEIVATCMADQGFDYVVAVPTDSSHAEFYLEIWELPPDEFVPRYGYGVSTLLAERAELRQTAPEDPNGVIYEGLSAGETAAYDEAMDGERRHGWSEGPDGAGRPALADSGCRGRAQEELFGGEGPNEWSALSNDLSWVGERIRDDSRVLAAAGQWRECMADAGYAGLTEVWDGTTAVSNRLDKINGDTEAALPYEEIDKDELRDVQEFELAIAVADHGCRDELGYADVFREVQLELEAEFVEQHHDELEAFREWLAAQVG